MYAGMKLEFLSIEIENDFAQGKRAEAQKKIKRFVELMRAMDRLLASHPVLTLEHWLSNPAALDKEQKRSDRAYEKNARRLITIWGYGPPLFDYAARIWGGLIRDFYLPRWEQYFANKLGAKNNLQQWETKWVTGQGTSEVKKHKDLVKASRDLVLMADAALAGLDSAAVKGLVSYIMQGELQAESVKEATLSMAELKAAKGISIPPAQGEPAFTVLEGWLHLDGQKVPLKLQGRELGAGKKLIKATWSIPAGATGNNECKLVLKLKKGQAQVGTAQIRIH